jgi:hypothetical protein
MLSLFYHAMPIHALPGVRMMNELGLLTSKLSSNPGTKGKNNKEKIKKQEI